MVFRLAYSVLLNQADAEDAVQDMFIKIIGKVPEFGDRAQEKAWISRVIVNQCRDQLRKRKLRLYTPLEELLEQTGEGEYLLRVLCSKGTYVRTICHDIGAALGCGGCMAALRRTRSGRFTLQDALTFEEIAALLAENALETRVFPTETVFYDLPEVHLNEEGDIRASHGNFFAERHIASGQRPEEGDLCRIHDSTGRFCQIGQTRQLDKGGLAIFCKINFGCKE
jgi:tRNA pseudouridine55 synthase